ncbi:MAG: hypothetical protein HYY76_12760 [Acidobacteria bacterium]|nr:hypothetical protein [Acidobacteriota bacterium]
MKTTAIITMLLVFLAADVARGQAASVGRGFVSVNGAYQITTNDFTDGAVKREHAEDGRFDATYAVKGGPAFDIAGGGMLWRQLGVGVGVSRFSVATPSSLSATIPHPFFFNRHRSIRADIADLQREELAVLPV